MLCHYDIAMSCLRSCHVLPSTTNCDFCSFPRNTCWYVNLYYSSYIITIMCYFTTYYIVTLTSSADRLCPGDTVVFTCVTGTGSLTWSSNGTTETYFTPDQVNEAARTLGIFSLQLLATTGGFKSTATVHNVSLYQDGANITCDDNSIDNRGYKTRSIMIRKPLSKFCNVS